MSGEGREVGNWGNWGNDGWGSRKRAEKVLSILFMGG